MRGLSDISGHVVASGLYSIEFTTQGLYRCLSIRFWKNDLLARVELYRHHQGETYPDCYLSAISQMLSFISSKSSLVSVSGCSSMVFRALETSGLSKNGIQYPFRFEVISLPELMHPNVLQTKHVFGRIDMYSQLKYLVVFLRGCQNQPSVSLQCSELCKVFIHFIFHCFDFYSLLRRFVVGFFFVVNVIQVFQCYSVPIL